MVLDIMAESGGQPISKLLKQFPQYYPVKVNVKVPSKEFQQSKTEIMKKISEMLPQNYDKLITIDGCKVFYGKNWLLVRSSGTEPLFRIFAEANNQEEANKLAAMGRNIINKAIKTVEK